MDSLTETPTISLRKRHLSSRAMAGLSSTSASKNFLALSPSFGLGPGCFLGASDAPSRRAAAHRLTEERLTPKARAASLLGVPRRRA